MRCALYVDLSFHENWIGRAYKIKRRKKKKSVSIKIIMTHNTNIESHRFVMTSAVKLCN